MADPSNLPLFMETCGTIMLQSIPLRTGLSFTTQLASMPITNVRPWSPSTMILPLMEFLDKLENWRPERNKFSRPYFHTYHSHVPKSFPEKDYDDRNALYSMWAKQSGQKFPLILLGGSTFTLLLCSLESRLTESRKSEMSYSATLLTASVSLMKRRDWYQNTSKAMRPLKRLYLLDCLSLWS